MKKTLLIILGILVLGVVIVLTSVITYLAVTKPFGIKIQNIPSAIIKSQSGSTNTVSNNPLLTPKQATTLQNLGVDTASLPTSITPAMEDCFIAKLGVKRANEIKGGSTVTVADYFKASSCVK